MSLNKNDMKRIDDIFNECLSNRRYMKLDKDKEYYPVIDSWHAEDLLIAERVNQYRDEIIELLHKLPESYWIPEGFQQFGGSYTNGDQEIILLGQAVGVVDPIIPEHFDKDLFIEGKQPITFRFHDPDDRPAITLREIEKFGYTHIVDSYRTIYLAAQKDKWKNIKK